MPRHIAAVIVGSLWLVACSQAGPVTGPTPPSTKPTPTTTTTDQPQSTTTALLTPSTTAFEAVDPGIDASIPEKHLENYLAALTAGAYEQAGFSMTDAGLGFGDNEDISAPTYLAAACDPDLCNGPYAVSHANPFIQYDGVAPPRWNFSVAHTPSGEVGTMTVGMFEGQFVIADLPPLVASPEHPDLAEMLFGPDQPAYVVIERFNAYEIHNGDAVTWTTNWFADETYQVEASYVIAGRTPDFNLLVGPITDPASATPHECPSLVIRKGVPYLYEYCGGPLLRGLETDDTAPLLIDPSALPRSEDEYPGFYEERGGVAVVTFSDAEGNTSNMVSSTGADLLDRDYAGYTTLSADGGLFVYTDHSQGTGTYNHFWSPVVVARDTATGQEVSRFLVDGPVTCVESDGRWIVVCEGSLDRIPDDPGTVALVAYNVDSGTLNRVETRTRLFLPSIP